MYCKQIPSIIGIGRIIGDGALYFYIQDLIVLPSYQQQGIGKFIMQQLLEHTSKKTLPTQAFIGLMAAAGTGPFL